MASYSDGPAGASVLPLQDVPPALIDAIAAIEAEFALVLGRPDRVAAACAAIAGAGVDWSRPEPAAALPRLTTLLRSRTGPLAEPLLAFVDDVLPAVADRWTVLRDLVGSRDARVCGWALDRAIALVEAGSLAVDPGLAATIAAAAGPDDAPINEPASLARVARLVGRLDLVTLYAGRGDPALRRLAARVLDLGPEPPSAAIAARLLGAPAAAFLEPYLAYTRATHVDLLDLASSDHEPPRAVASIREAETACGADLVREVIAALGWRRLSGGLAIRRLVGVSVAGGFPLLLSPAEAALLEDRPDVARVFDRVLFVAHGAAAVGLGSAVAGGESVPRFRAYNLAHADALADILDVAPLTIDKVRRILDRMAIIVEGFVALFGSHTDECAVIADVHAQLAARIRRELELAGPDAPLSPELTRLVQMFEDPRSPGEVRTLHGLKRYLHQRGLRLGFRLAEAGRNTNRTIDLVLASDRRVLHVSPVVEYVDFEDGPSPALDGPAAPHAVTLVAESFGRQLVHGHTTLPKVRVFCYGNEVHYFVAFRNHPAFVRVDFSPPARGGMIDLEYFGVSKYEMSAHPNVSLDGIRTFFERLDFDVQIEHTRVRARYDKERSPDLADLCDKVDQLFDLTPYLMDVDWTIGNLVLDEPARRLVTEAWAEFFARWSALPAAEFMTADRQGILAGLEPSPDGVREVRWSGVAPYRDRFTVASPPDFWSGLASAMAARGLRTLPFVDGDVPVGQRTLDQHLLVPLRRAVSRGEIVDTGRSLELASADRFRREHEAGRFARILTADAGTIARSAQLARLVSHLERLVHLETTGTLNGYAVGRGSLPLRGAPLTLYALADGAGMPRLAFFAADDAVYQAPDGDDGWRTNARLDAETLVARLRRDNVPAEWIPPSPAAAGEIAAHVLSAFATVNPEGTGRPAAGERIVEGLRASPGRAVGLARLGTAGRRPADLEGGILVAPALSPDDSALLFRAAGVLSTGGGVLSHAGLLAMQFGKPAVIVAGTWRRTASGSPLVTYRAVEHEERSYEVEGYAITELRRVRTRHDEIQDGDLLVLDADQGRVQVLGQDPDALALHEELRQLARATRRLSNASADTDLLAERGHRLRARHQLEKLLARLTDPVLVGHAVRELLVSDPTGGASAARDDRALMLRHLLANPAATDDAREAIARVAREISGRAATARERAAHLVPLVEDCHEILWLRLAAVRFLRALEGVRELLAECGLEVEAAAGDGADLDALVADRLAALGRRLLSQARRASEPDGYEAPLRHVLRQIARLDLVLGTPAADRAETDAMRAALAERDAAVLEDVRGRRIIMPGDGGLNLRPLVGSKAANLAEVARLGYGVLVPGWFVVTDRAFREALAAPVPGARGTLEAVIDEILARAETSDAEKSQLVRRAWETVRLPRELVREVVAAYRALGGRAGADVQVAVRSSAREEDTEAAARAGEFDTFLFVRGEASLLEHLRRAWSGLWTERAMHNRAVVGADTTDVGGGVLVQRMVDARVSGVLHTVNVAEGRLDEIVINAGLGLGEGIVSGAVAADLVVVSKEESLSSTKLRFRYMTADKRERVVLDARTGSGTMRQPTLYHQRLRPALEYVELCELVQAAARLERAYGQPLDLEFAIEDTTLRVLQVRPVPAAVSIWRETVAHHPLARTSSEAHHDSP